MEIEFNTDNSVKAPTDTNEKVQSEGIHEITVDSPESPSTHRCSTKPAARETNKEKDSLSIAFVAYPFKNVNPAEKVLQFIHTPSTPSQEPQSPKGLYVCALDTPDSADSKTSIVEEVQDATKRKPQKVSTTMARSVNLQQQQESKTASHDAKSSFIFTVNSDEHKLKKKESQVKFTPVVSPVHDLDSPMTKKGKRIGKYRHEFMKLSEKLSWTSTTSLKSSSSTKSSKDYPMKFDPKRHPGSFSTVDRLSYR